MKRDFMELVLFKNKDGDLNDQVIMKNWLQKSI